MPRGLRFSCGSGRPTLYRPSATFAQHIEFIAKIVVLRLARPVPDFKIGPRKPKTKRPPRSPKSSPPGQTDLLQPRLEDFLNMSHPIVVLAGLIDWAVFASLLDFPVARTRI